MKNAAAQLKWSIEMGADDAVGDSPRNYLQAAPALLQDSLPDLSSPVQKEPAGFAEPPTPAFAAAVPPRPVMSRASAAIPASLAAAIAQARTLADKAATLDELREAISAFDGCSIKKTAQRTVFAEGSPRTRVMLIGEAPGAKEDEMGVPFCGPSGKLLDAMLACIGLSRAENIYITNTVFWRPPGNRQPTREELLICEPFVEKHIALVSPALIILVGGTATMGVLRSETSVSRLRASPQAYTNGYLQAAGIESLPVAVTYHPSYLLRQPTAKRQAWQDLLKIKEFLTKTT